MTVQELEIKIEKKEQQIAKLQKLYEKYSKENAEEKAILERLLETEDKTEYRAWLKREGMYYGTDAYMKVLDIIEARHTLEKYRKQLTAAKDKESTLAEMPQCIIDFKNDVISRWDSYDIWKREQIRIDYRELIENELDRKQKNENRYTIRDKWGMGYYEFMFLTDEQIHKANVTAAEALVLNFIARTTEIAGKITDCTALRLSQDNAGYSIINGVVIGEKGKAYVSSIGAGGYNIQRYHIRVLVKEVR